MEVPGPRSALRTIAPYAAVGLCWCWLESAWATLLCYHGMILLLAEGPPRLSSRDWRLARLWPAFPAVLAGPLVYLLLPEMTRASLFEWLARYGLHGVGLLMIVPYYGLVHPVLEQLHWRDLRSLSPLSHLAFAGYHMLVLGDLFRLPWLIVLFVVLAASSAWWGRLERRSPVTAVPLFSHVLADAGVIVAALARS
jgi:hypothetical protein